LGFFASRPKCRIKIRSFHRQGYPDREFELPGFWGILRRVRVLWAEFKLSKAANRLGGIEVAGVDNRTVFAAH
jgi:hypothetical protein